MQSDLLLTLIFDLPRLFLWVVVICVVFFLLFLLAYLLIIFYRHRHREERSLDFVLLQVAVPKENEVKIDAAEQIFASLYSIKKGGGFFSFLRPQEHLSFEIVAKPEDIRFYIAVPARLKDMLEKQIHGVYAGADVTEVPEYNIFSEEGKVVFSQLQLRSSAYNPIKTYRELPTDSLALLTSTLAKMQPGEGAAIQILITPAENSWRARGRKYLSSVKKAEADPEKAKFGVDPKTMEAIENKCSKPGFESAIRIVVSSTSTEAAKMHLANIRAAFEQFSGDLNGFKSKKIHWPAAFMLDFLYRYQPMFYLGSHKTILNPEELATIFHFPNKTVETPYIFCVYAKRAPSPQEIPSSGLLLGKNVYRGISRPIYIEENDRRRHIYIVGKTGTGKSEFLKEMILQDIKVGRGVCFIDPHDTIEKILPLIPPERAEDVVYFYPGDTARPMGLNLLEADTEDQKHFVATSIVGLMYKLYDPYKTGIIGPRFEHAIRNAMLTVMCEPGNTFVEVMRCLQDPSFVQELLPKVSDPIVRRYWTDQIAQTADFHKSEVLDYIVSKFGRFVTNKMMRNIIGQSQSAFNFRQVMDQGKILLVNLAKGEIGEENSNFLGLVLVPKILIAAMSRSDTPEEQRRDFYLYVDEFQNFATPDFATILSEARKFRLNLCVANQFIGQVEEEVKNAVFGNVGTIIAFRVGVSDAQYLVHEFQPVFSESDLINIDAFNAYVKTIVHNEPVPPFSMDLTKDMAREKALSNPKVADLIREMSALRFGRERTVVETEITRRARL